MHDEGIQVDLGEQVRGVKRQIGPLTVGAERDVMYMPRLPFQIPSAIEPLLGRERKRPCEALGRPASSEHAVWVDATRLSRAQVRAVEKRDLARPAELCGGIGAYRIAADVLDDLVGDREGENVEPRELQRVELDAERGIPRSHFGHGREGAADRPIGPAGQIHVQGERAAAPGTQPLAPVHHREARPDVAPLV